MIKTLEELRAIAEREVDRALKTDADGKMAPEWSAVAAQWLGRLIELDAAQAECRKTTGRSLRDIKRDVFPECSHGVPLSQECRMCRGAG